MLTRQVTQVRQIVQILIFVAFRWRISANSGLYRVTVTAVAFVTLTPATVVAVQLFAFRHGTTRFWENELKLDLFYPEVGVFWKIQLRPIL